MKKRGGSRPGAGRPAKQPGLKRRALSTTISETSWQILRQLADRSGQSVSQVLDDLIALAALHPKVAMLVDVEAASSEAGPADEPLPDGMRTPPTVLVLEDDAQAQELLRVRLEWMGCTVLITDSAEEAFVMAVDHRPGFVIADLELQTDRRAGWSFVQRMRENPETASIPIAIHSIYVRHSDELPAALPDVEALLPKPFKLQQLSEIVARLIDVVDREADVIIL